MESELKQTCGIRASLNIVGVDDSAASATAAGEGDADDLQDDMGTANSLYLLKDKLVTDCMIVSCDLIVNVDIQRMASFFRVNNASFVMLLSDNMDSSPELPLPGTKGKYVPGK